ncbi:MAG: SHOCT domain-containing protein [Limnochordaceae bacterium]|nr:SHOCT domain-containing protein [Limnochordaceae bacterium]
MWTWHGGGGPGVMWYGSWWIGGVMTIVFWALVIAGIVLLVRALTSPGRTWARAEESRAMAILEERFARGEITAEEFRHMRDELRQSRRSSV